MTKGELRAQMISIAKATPGAPASEVANVICSLSSYKRAKIVFGYIPLKSEVDITEVMDRAVKDGKTIAFPTENPGVFVIGHEDWKEKIVRLKNRTSTLLSTETLTFADERSIIPQGVILVPGLAFTEFGTRLGRGAGYYDQTLLMLTKRTNKTDLFSIGICKCAQLVTTLPTEPHDMTVNVVLAF